MPLFDYAVTLKPTPEDAKKGARETIIVQPSTCVAANESEAMTIAARAIPAEYADALDRVDVSVRPF